MLLSELVAGQQVLEAGGPQDVDVSGIAYDSRKVEDGFLFVAVEGFRTDGHLYLEDAARRGAVAVVIQKQVQVPAGLAWVRVPDTRLALALMAARYYGNPSARLKMIGVTGTNGKTTTTHLIREIYREAGYRVGLIGTIHNFIGDRSLPVQHTTPESLELQSLLAQMEAAGVQVVSMEVSSHALSLHRVAGCYFDVAVFTNISQDHLDFHRDMEDYLAAKAKLFAGLDVDSPKPGTKYAVVNADDPHAGRIIEKSGGRVVTYGIEKPADVVARDIIVTSRGASFEVVGEHGRVRLNLRLTGLFNVYNALASFAVGRLEGIPVETVKEALESVTGIRGRFELVNRGQDFTVVIDYAHTPDGLENVLKTAGEIKDGRLITVFGCGGDRDRTKRPLMGEIAARLSDVVVVTSDNPRSEDPEAIIEDILDGLRRVPGGRYEVVVDRRQAIRRAIEMAERGDVVVIAGKGHEDYQIIGDQRFHFDDREEAVIILEELMAGSREKTS